MTQGCIICGCNKDDEYLILRDTKYFCSEEHYALYYSANNTKITIPPIEVSGGLTNTELRAAPLSINGTVNVGLTDTQLRATPLPISGNITVNTGLTDTQLRATALPVTQAPFSATKVMKTGTLVTTAVTGDQVILTYTVTSGKTLYLKYLKIDTRLTTFAVTATNFGLASLESPAGTKLLTQMQSGAGITLIPPYLLDLITVPSGTVIRVVCTPAAVTSYTWIANFGGYEL
jgi:hypothetical protein